jgi:uncharacterized RDD family membrane protein YckC
LRLDTLTRAETPEGIELALRPAGVVARSGAFAIDLLLRGGVLLAAAMILAPLGRFGSGLGLILWFALEWFYPVLFELLPGNATPGKRAFGLRVTMDSGLPVTPAASLLRNLLRAADFLPFGYGLGLASILMRGDFKRLGDIAAGTLVVHAQRPRLHGAVPEAAPAAPARALSPRAQAAVIAWAGRATRITEARLAELALLAAPATGANAATSPRDAVVRLLAVAQWLMGRR